MSSAVGWQLPEDAPTTRFATRAYVRSTGDPNATATKGRRLPFVEEVAPHHLRSGKPALDLRPKR